MIYKVKFEDHFDEEWYGTQEYLINVSNTSEIKKHISSKFSKGYIKILSIEEFTLNEGEILDITHHYGAVG